jgi:ribose transport system substrate-binding protein
MLLEREGETVLSRLSSVDVRPDVRRMGAVAGVAATLLAVGGLALSSSASASSGSSAIAHYTSIQDVVKAYPITKFCGKKNVTIGMPLSNTGGFFEVEVAMVKQLATACPNVKMVTPVNTDDTLQTELANLNAMVAQNVSGILSQATFGAGQLPGFRSATRAGVAVWNFTATPPGAKIPTDIAGAVLPDYTIAGQDWAAFYNKVLGPKGGKIVFLGGNAGSASSQDFMTGLNEAVKKYPSLHLVSPNFQVTNYSAATERSVMAGLLAKYGRIAGVSSDYGTNMTSVLSAYQAAGIKLPAIATVATGNALTCAWQQAKVKFPLYSLDSFMSEAVVGFRHVLAQVEGIHDPEPTTLAPFPIINTTANLKAKCVAGAPAGLLFDTTLSVKQQEAALAAS